MWYSVPYTIYRNEKSSKQLYIDFLRNDGVSYLKRESGVSPELPPQL